MSTVRLRDVSKFYQKTRVVESVSLDIAHGEFFSLLGPSGCGKTTTLRMVAGLTPPSCGVIEIGERIVCDVERKISVPPEKRNIGMVFQSYAIWPHYCVLENVAFPLKMRKLARNEILGRVEKILALVGLAGLEKRFPHELSGGQQQRVALARALVMEPALLLLDEPLSNLDAKLRFDMRGEIRRLQKRLSITVLYVTHDQGEAMAMSDRVVIMNAGKICQIGTPHELREHSTDPFVAEFLSRPEHD